MWNWDGRIGITEEKGRRQGIWSSINSKGDMKGEIAMQCETEGVYFWVEEAS